MFYLSSTYSNFTDYNFLILYNMKYMISVVASLILVVIVGSLSVYCVYLLLTLIRGMVS